MKKTQTFFFWLFIIFFPIITFGQELIVPPWNGSNYLNDVIVGDTTASGQRNDLNRIYLLQRNGVYFVNTPIRNTAWPLRIKAQDGTCLLYTSKEETGVMRE